MEKRVIESCVLDDMVSNSCIYKW